MLKKYKLIRKYPNSPELGSIAIYDNGNGYRIEGIGFYTINTIENNSEYWQEIIEEPYPRILEWLGDRTIINKVAKSPTETFQIGDKTNKGVIEEFSITKQYRGSVTNFVGESIAAIFKDDEWIDVSLLEHYKEVFPRIYSFRHKFGERKIYKLTDSGIFTDYKESFGFNYLLEEPLYTIHQIQISENEILTVGDKVKHENGKVYTILSFYQNCIINATGKASLDPYKVKKLNKIFTTEDVVDIFEDDEYWYIEDNNIYKASKATYGSGRGYNLGSRYFSTKEKAEEYIEKNKVILVTEDGKGLKVGDTVWMLENEHIWDSVIKPINRPYHHITDSLKNCKAFSTKELAEQYIDQNEKKFSKSDIKVLFNL